MKQLLTAAAVWLAWAFGPAATAAVIITALPQPLLLRDEFFGSYHPVDVDANSITDFTFGLSVSGVGLRTERANRAVITLDPPPNIGGPPYQLPAGYLVGSTLAPSGFDSLLWASSDSLDGYVSPTDTGVFMGIVQVLSTGSSSSFNGRGFIGVEFESTFGTHYGYLDIDAGPGYAGITLYGWAYETQPSVPIFAGQVPEPSRLLLLGIGSIFLLSRRHRQPRQNRVEVTGLLGLTHTKIHPRSQDSRQMISRRFGSSGK